MKWDIIQMRMNITIKNDTTPYPPFIDKTLMCHSPIYRFMWLFLWCLNVSELKKDLLQRGHTNPTPKCTLHTWVQMVPHEVDGPSLQPSTWQLYTLLMPSNWIQRGCMSAGISPSKTEGAVEEVDSSAWSAGTEASGSLDSWGGRWEMVEEGAWQDFLGGGEDVGREECNTAPLRSPYNPPPLNQSPPPRSSLTPPSPDAGPCFPVCMLPYAVNWLTLKDSAPIKENIKREMRE